MMHDGAIVVVRNIGATACTLPALPTLPMRDANGHVVATSAPAGSRFMHPGPVVLPIELGVGEIAASTIRWIDGDVFGDGSGRRAIATTLALDIDGAIVSAPLAATIWGRANTAITFDETRLSTQLPLLGPRTKPVAGTYVGEGPAGSTYVDANGQPARRLVLRNGRGEGLSFTFDGIGGAAPNIGSIAGPLAMHGDRTTFHDRSRDCNLAFAFFDEELTVNQTGSCGFGNGVSATGQYRVK